MSKKIVIVGALGYLGTELCKLYSGESWFHNIVAIDNRFVSKRINQLKDWNIKFYQGQILDKDFLIEEIKNLNERNIDDKFINFTIFKDNNEINLFFDKSKFNLIGWQTIDIYQNLNITYLSSIKKNQNIKKKLFELPPMN